MPSAEQVDRFRRDCVALTGEAPELLALAVSGGPDSLALLLLSAAAFPGRVAAATVDHGLRPESKAEAAFVAELCRSRDVPHAALSVRVDTGRSSLQRSAREARYAALGAWLEREAIPFLATGHHLDDQAETLLMRLLRGSGASGLAAIRAAGPVPGGKGRLVRPLLSWRRSELAEIVRAAGIVPVDDPANRDPRHDRTAIRRHLAETPWLDPEALAQSAAALAQTEEALAWITDRLWEERASRDGNRLSLHAQGLPPELVRRLILRVAAELAPGASPRGQEVSQLAAALQAGGSATLAGILARGGECWTFEPAPPRRR